MIACVASAVKNHKSFTEGLLGPKTNGLVPIDSATEWIKEANFCKGLDDPTYAFVPLKSALALKRLIRIDLEKVTAEEALLLDAYFSASPARNFLSGI